MLTHDTHIQEFSQDQVFQEDLDLFQHSLRSMIHRALQGARDTWCVCVYVCVRARVSV